VSQPPPFLPPTDPALLRPETRPYFLWWTDVTVAELGRLLRSGDEDSRAYWMGALLREANTRDAWLFVTPDEVRGLWLRLSRHLGRSRDMWCWLLDLPRAPWPPAEARRAP
jgi:hypothetical protein